MRGRQYIEQRNGGYYVAGTRISLDSLVYSFSEGQSPDAIQEDFPMLRRSHIFGAIAFYLDNQAKIDRYLEEARREFEVCGIPMSAANPALWERVAHEGRVPVSHDLRTILSHFHDHLTEGRSSPGLLVVSQGAPITCRL